MTVPSAEFLFAAVLVIALLALAVYYGWREVQTLRLLKDPSALEPDERRYRRARAWRRLTNSVLMAVLAFLLLGSYFLGMEQRATALAGLVRRNAAPPTAEQQQFLNRYGALWGAFAVIFLAVVCIALYDAWAIRRFWVRNYRQIQADRRAMIKEEVARIRTQRNGQ